MKFKSIIAAAFAVALSCSQAFGQATIMPPGETCFQATTGINGMVGLLGTITGGSGYVNGTYGGVSLTGGSGSNATANITVSGGIVTAVAILNPGINYVVGDVLSASASSIGGSGSGFSVPVSSISINSSLAGGTVGFYVPNTQTFKQTWQNSGETVLNQNPVPLDGNGCAIIYGAGIYRQILKDSLGNTVWDQLTASTSNGAGIYWAAAAGGTPNAITITDASFAFVDGTTIQFLALSQNTGPTTISVSGSGVIPIVKDTSTGPTALSGGEIGPANAPMITYDATNLEFHLVNPASGGSSGGSGTAAVAPQGYLNLVGQASGDVIQTGDVIGTSTIYYSPYVGNQVPIWNGSSFRILTFSELTMTMTSIGSPASSIQDACVFSNNGVPTLVLGPQWTSAAAGAGSRGTGAGTAQLIRLQGIWVNANSITAYNGLASYTIAANQCTYVGSISVDSTAGVVSAYKSFGQSRKWGVWNAYNRQQIALTGGDPTASWVGGSTTWRSSNNNANNYVSAFTGLPEESLLSDFQQNISVGYANTSIIAQIGIGLNGGSPSGNIGQLIGTDTVSGTFTVGSVMKAKLQVTPTIGIMNFIMLEQVPTGTVSAATLYGTLVNMSLTVNYRG